MASIIYPNVALPVIANRILGSGLHYHLFNSPVPESKDADLASFHEPTVDGYVPVNVAAWTMQGVIADHGVNQAALIHFFNTDAVDDDLIFGYFVTDAANTHLLWFLVFDTPKPFPALIGDIQVSPYYGDFSAFPTE